MESAVVFDLEGRVIYHHAPHGRSAVSIPDSRTLWDILWENRGNLGGVAHSHPWNGVAAPSQTDVTTFQAVEAALGKRLAWPIVTFSETVTFRWDGQHYSPSEPFEFDDKLLGG